MFQVQIDDYTVQAEGPVLQLYAKKQEGAQGWDYLLSLSGYNL